ncbi:MAG: tRNA preQ1(34) S-adenosylmethionine ribosyltransferase-isomerase QueA [Armatimonadota bacterium]|nr:tRNA preQ1(34) S-adenosylmethionine ribosyltransferase-isomerase QueA [Armatimonadota bacterium]MDR7452426.1 tRNA preQ1(34) S-adenosylmethionine ribosyltransferase-isomerase QueA [Armatimonadota bacterium]MDR7468083.1 tRNA preQ1(34) S-adenosylmethionine ribosyltransferase-isomerase QueA [Armatimonadota bacterium]MDR7494653.1 tRNA preQ1(34) S-adenosylmethionine ribosyltransferase-isomerase QueA [Armatimonadota bacterium]MDR7500214.1 tRNA preQ1(34) S-adenosylmethionine ribosyltransferase-isome
MRLSDFDYALPPELIAQHPVSPRDAARLLVVHRRDGRLEHRVFRDLPDYLRPQDALIVNNTRVIPARLTGRKPTGGLVEVLLLRPAATSDAGGSGGGELWEALVRPGRRVPRGTRLTFAGGVAGEVVASRAGGIRLIAFASARPIIDVLREIGTTPLPPYIREPLRDPEEYQTIFAAANGAVAAPTAGLHFTPQLLERIRGMGVAVVFLTMHIGVGTFRSITTEDPARHRMDAEWYEVSPEAAAAINRVRARGGRLVAVGTSTVRTLETVTDDTGVVHSGSGWSRLYIVPGHRFRAVDALVTNFHLPRTTLLVLVCALAGRELILRAYAEAIKERYRFYSFGDAMLIL